MYDWTITAKKFVYGLVIAFIPVGLAYSINFLESGELPPEYLVYVPMVVGLLTALQNYFKHRKD